MSDAQASLLVQMFGAGATLAPEFMSTFRSAAFTEDIELENGNHLIRGVPIFRAGVFKDSRGIERTWTTAQLAEIASNFTLLKNDGTFPNVPVRIDHSMSANDVVGYFEAVYVDPQDPTMLLGDIEITEPDAYGKWKRGTYRSRSLEVGPYERNGESGQFTWPTVLGLAFVDVPAIEGLHRQAPPQHFSQFVQDGAPPNPQKDLITMNEAALRSLQAHIDGGGTADSWIAACNFAQQQADHARQQDEANQQFQRACDYASALNVWQAQAQALGIDLTGLNGTHSFRINGTPTTDPAAVQRHIDSLQTALSTIAETERADYVKSLVTDGKIAAPMETPTLAMVETFSTEQFQQFRTTYDAMPKASMFQNHGVEGSQGGGGTGNDKPAEPAEADTLKEVVAQFRRAGKDDDFIKGTKAYKRLITLDATQTIA